MCYVSTYVYGVKVYFENKKDQPTSIETHFSHTHHHHQPTTNILTHNPQQEQRPLRIAVLGGSFSAGGAVADMRDSYAEVLASLLSGG